MTQPDPNDPLKANYGDAPLVQSVTITDRWWTEIKTLTVGQAG
jgi:hypothetical protein